MCFISKLVVLVNGLELSKKIHMKIANRKNTFATKDDENVVTTVELYRDGNRSGEARYLLVGVN